MTSGTSERDHLQLLGRELTEELQKEILPYWMKKVSDEENGGYIGQITGMEKRKSKAEKSVILNARLLWTFSAAYRVFGKDEYLQQAHRAFSYMEAHFWDTTHGGFFWSVDHKGKVSNDKKHVYAQAFAIYGYSEYGRATGSEISLKRAFETFDLLESHTADLTHGGYFEAFSRNWILLDDVRLSDGDANEERSMNTHLHIMEAYANLYRVESRTDLASRLEDVIDLILTKIYNEKTGHFDTFFDRGWNRRSECYSYGHDIEAAWLLIDASEALNDSELKFRAEKTAEKVSYTTLNEAIDLQTNGVFNTGKNGKPLDKDFHWWAQAETIAGFLYAFESTGDSIFLEKSVLIWQFIKDVVKDSNNGEWYFRVDTQGKPYREEDKVGPWKCPYHNSRVCLITAERFEKGQLEHESYLKLSSNSDELKSAE
ncbi:MAG: N-acyl-D-glucosamine 2-epimerase [Bacteroidetes bacterium]|jgi:mannobiose 2-epimerase|nr:N-acyl-D-glucosamine 2-epimerase [Bacteroidota bacterium]